jgi:dephospho-CoA kinase
VAFVVGLTGGIGSGKSAVSDGFAALGVEVTDTDAIAHALTAPGQPGHAAVLDAFGDALLRSDGTLDRTRLREQVFGDSDARARLEAILHPLIRDAAARQMARWRGPYGIVVVPLLFERGGLDGIVQRALVVDCPEDEQVRRVMARSDMTADEVRAIMATQLSRRERLARADDVIDNAGTPDALAPKIEQLDRRYRTLAAAATSSAGRR